MFRFEEIIPRAAFQANADATAMMDDNVATFADGFWIDFSRSVALIRRQIRAEIAQVADVRLGCEEDGNGARDWSIFLHQRGKARGYDESVTQPRKPSPTESPLLFELDDEPLHETLTAWGGVPLAVQEFRSLGVSARVRQHVHIKQREHGYDAAKESPFVKWIES